MLEFDYLTPIIQNMLDWNVVIGPALSSVGVGGLDEETYARISDEAEYLTRRFWSKPLPVVGSDALVPFSVVHRAMCETISSTAAYLSHLKLGYLKIDETMIRVASRLFEEFRKNCDVSHLHTLIILVHAYDNYVVVEHYQRVKRSQFISGELHRPWVHYSLDDELLLMENVGSLKVFEEDGDQYVDMTPFGEERFHAFQKILRESGFLSRRSSLMRLSQFSQLADYDELTDRLGDLATARKMVLDRAEIHPGMRVLELGCGTGSMTINAGLYQRVGKTGTIVATDPSFGMLTRAKQKAADRRVTNVEFVQARAEELHFSDNSFDAVIGCSFLHFTDIPTVMKEVHRVLKPGSRLTTYYPLDYSQSQEFFLEWFEPVLSQIPPNQKRDRLPREEDVPNAMDGLFDEITLWDHGHPIDHRNPKDVVRFFVQVGNIFEAAFENLPWRAKMDILEELVRRGNKVVARYPDEALVQIHPHQLVRGRVKKATATTE